jgi:hypothetical protein
VKDGRNKSSRMTGERRIAYIRQAPRGARKRLDLDSADWGWRRRSAGFALNLVPGEAIEIIGRKRIGSLCLRSAQSQFLRAPAPAPADLAGRAAAHKAAPPL